MLLVKDLRDDAQLYPILFGRGKNKGGNKCHVWWKLDLGRVSNNMYLCLYSIFLLFSSFLPGPFHLQAWVPIKVKEFAFLFLFNSLRSSIIV